MSKVDELQLKQAIGQLAVVKDASLITLMEMQRHHLQQIPYIKNSDWDDIGTSVIGITHEREMVLLGSDTKLYRCQVSIYATRMMLGLGLESDEMYAAQVQTEIDIINQFPQLFVR